MDAASKLAAVLERRLHALKTKALQRFRDHMLAQRRLQKRRAAATLVEVLARAYRKLAKRALGLFGDNVARSKAFQRRRAVERRRRERA